jgi:hypothetical protein
MLAVGIICVGLVFPVAAQVSPQEESAILAIIEYVPPFASISTTRHMVIAIGLASSQKKIRETFLPMAFC